MLSRLKSIYRFLNPKFQNLHLEYKTEFKPRYNETPHGLLNELIAQNHEVYDKWIDKILSNREVFEHWKMTDDQSDQSLPTWENGYFPALDMMTLYTMVAELDPANIVEIGSGNSTKVMADAKRNNKLSISITSIDPVPRAIIDNLSDQIIRMPLESIDLKEIKSLRKGDILFIDNSHRMLPNSDVTTVFLDIMPYLAKGVYVHIHDIYLPYDYPQFMCDRFYSEQYGLAIFLLSNPDRYKVIFPSYYIYKNRELSSRLNDIWTIPNISKGERHGGSIWLKIS